MVSFVEPSNGILFSLGVHFAHKHLSICRIEKKMGIGPEFGKKSGVDKNLEKRKETNFPDPIYLNFLYSAQFGCLIV